MEKVAYLRIFGVPEVDNVNRKYYEGLNCKVIEDNDGSKFESTINNTDYDVVIDIRTVANMLMYNINLDNLDNREMLPLNAACRNRDWLRRVLINRKGLSRYDDSFMKSSAVSSDIECAQYFATVQASNLEVMLEIK